MENRYELFSKVGARNIAGFNAKVAEYNAQSEMKQVPLPLIVVIVDELADLMMTERKSVEQQIARLAQKARAAGIHMIVATQRPSVDVVTGLIKANIPTRMAFTVQSKIDSRTILDQMGADELLKYGDSLFLQPGSAEPTRLQGAFVSDDEVHQVVNFVKEQAPTNYVEGLLSGEAPSKPPILSIRMQTAMSYLIKPLPSYWRAARLPFLPCNANCASATTVPPI